VAFEFTDCYYRTSSKPEEFLKGAFVGLAARVMFSRGQMRICRMMREWEDSGAEDVEEDGRLVPAGERVDLRALVEGWDGEVMKMDECDKHMEDVEC
jgi:hypothetical protein